MSFSEALKVLRQIDGAKLTRNHKGDHIVLDRSGTQVYPVEPVASTPEPTIPEAKQFGIPKRVRDAFTANELAELETQGDLLEDLMTGRIAPRTADQQQFVAMCKGNAEPPNELAKLWKKLCIEEGFQRAKDAERLLQNPAKLVANNYQTVVERFKLLAEQGHTGALHWLEKEEVFFSVPSPPPKLNLHRGLFFQTAFHAKDLFDSGRMVHGGSPGSGRPNARRRMGSKE